MKSISRSACFAVIFASFGATIAVAQTTPAANSLDGRWDASLTSHGTVIPFRLDISGSGPTLKGTFYDGFKPYDGTTSASFQDGKLVLNVEHYLTTITATLKDERLTGNVVTQSRGPAAEYAFLATRHVAEAAAAVFDECPQWRLRSEQEREVRIKLHAAFIRIGAKDGSSDYVEDILESLRRVRP